MGLRRGNGNKFKIMKSQDKFLIAGLLGCFLTVPAPAQELGNWSLSESKSTDGSSLFSASIHATNLITSGGPEPDYAPLYSIACRAGDADQWIQTLELEDAISGSGKIELSARVDDKMPREEIWVIGDKNHILIRENSPDIAELRTAHKLTLKWNWGWSWLWLNDKARIELGDIEAVIFTLSKNCGIAEPS